MMSRKMTMDRALSPSLESPPATDDMRSEDSTLHQEIATSSNGARMRMSEGGVNNQQAHATTSLISQEYAGIDNITNGENTVLMQTVSPVFPMLGNPIAQNGITEHSMEDYYSIGNRNYLQRNNSLIENAGVISPPNILDSNFNRSQMNAMPATGVVEVDHLSPRTNNINGSPGTSFGESEFGLHSRDRPGNCMEGQVAPQQMEVDAVEINEDPFLTNMEFGLVLFDLRKDMIGGLGSNDNCPRFSNEIESVVNQYFDNVNLSFTSTTVNTNGVHELAEELREDSTNLASINEVLPNDSMAIQQIPHELAEELREDSINLASINEVLPNDSMAIQQIPTTESIDNNKDTKSEVVKVADSTVTSYNPSTNTVLNASPESDLAGIEEAQLGMAQNTVNATRCNTVTNHPLVTRNGSLGNNLLVNENITSNVVQCVSSDCSTCNTSSSHRDHYRNLSGAENGTPNVTQSAENVVTSENTQKGPEEAHTVENTSGDTSTNHPVRNESPGSNTVMTGTPIDDATIPRHIVYLPICSMQEQMQGIDTVPCLLHQHEPPSHYIVTPTNTDIVRDRILYSCYLQHVWYRNFLDRNHGALSTAHVCYYNPQPEDNSIPAAATPSTSQFTPPTPNNLSICRTYYFHSFGELPILQFTPNLMAQLNATGNVENNIPHSTAGIPAGPQNRCPRYFVPQVLINNIVRNDPIAVNTNTSGNSSNDLAAVAERLPNTAPIVASTNLEVSGQSEAMRATNAQSNSNAKKRKAKTTKKDRKTNRSTPWYDRKHNKKSK